MRHSVQMYTLRSQNQQNILFRELKAEVPLACKKAEEPLVPMEAPCQLETPQGDFKGQVRLDPESLAIQVKGSGSTFDILEDAEFLRLKKHLLRCWINLLRSRQATSTAQHKKDIAHAHQTLRALSCA